MIMPERTRRAAFVKCGLLLTFMLPVGDEHFRELPCRIIVPSNEAWHINRARKLWP